MKRILIAMKEVLAGIFHETLLPLLVVGGVTVLVTLFIFKVIEALR